MEDNDYKILYQKLADKVKRMRAWQKARDRRRDRMPADDYRRMKQLESQVDNILLLDEEGIKVFVKSNL